jgi:uncharacterized membrane protein YfcA
MCAVVLQSFVALMLITKGAETPPDGLSLSSISLLVFGFFLLSFAIAVIAVMAGIGGGVLFTPIMLAFTPVNSLIVRATGLIVAMFSGLISSGPLARKGLGNLKLAMVCCLGYGSGSFAGAGYRVSLLQLSQPPLSVLFDLAGILAVGDLGGDVPGFPRGSFLGRPARPSRRSHPAGIGDRLLQCGAGASGGGTGFPARETSQDRMDGHRPGDHDTSDAVNAGGVPSLRLA